MNIDEWMAERGRRIRRYKRGQQRAAARLEAYDQTHDPFILAGLMRSVRALDVLYLSMWEPIPADIEADDGERAQEGH